MSSVLKTYLALLAEKQLLPTKPRKKTLGEGILVLLEAKIDKYIEQYRDDLKTSNFLNALKASNIQPKYVDWAVRAYKNPNRPHYDDAYMATTFKDLIDKFDSLLRKNQIPVESKDINSFKDFYELKDTVVKIETTYSQNQREKAKKDSAEGRRKVVYQDDTYTVIEPMSTESSCKYGTGTQWCISATQSRNYFEDYASQGARFLFIINKKNNDKDAIAFAGNISEIEIYNSADDSKGTDYISNKYPQEVLEAVNSYLDSIIGTSPFQAFKTREIWDNPIQILSWDDPLKILAMNKDALFPILRKLLKTPIEDASLARVRHNLVESALHQTIRNMKMTERGAMRLLEVALMDPEQQFFGMNYQLIKKLFFHVLYQVKVENNPGWEGDVAVLVALSFFPTESSKLLQGTDWDLLRNKLANRIYVQQDMLHITATQQKIFDAVVKFVNFPELRSAMWFLDPNRTIHPEQMGPVLYFYDQLSKASNYMGIHSLADMIKYAQSLVANDQSR